MMKSFEKALAHLPSTSERVPVHTSVTVNDRIRNETIMRLESIGHDPDRIDKRLEQIEKEWDIERTLEANAAVVILLGLGFSLVGGKKWLLLPSMAAAFLLRHSLEGWCPPLSYFRRHKVRTQREIDNERTILKSRRGDLEWLQDGAHEALLAMEKKVPKRMIY